MTVYYDTFLNHMEIKDNKFLLHLKARSKYFLSWSLISQLSNLRSYMFDSDCILVSVSKENLYGLDTSEFLEDDWNFIRTIYSVFEFGKYVNIEMYVHFVL